MRCSLHNQRQFAGPHARRGSIGTLLLIGLVILLGILMYVKNEHNKQELAKRRQIFASQSEPQEALDTFFLNTGTQFDLNRPDWKVMIDYTSSEDMEWLNRYAEFLASANMSPDARSFSGSDQEHQQYRALTGLYFVGHHFRPIISGGQINGNHAVVYYHAPNDPASMKEAFFVNESGRWKMRRFLGARDAFTLMQRITVSKQAAGAALDADEQQFVNDPANYTEWKRRQLLTEAGVQGAAPTAGAPAAAPGTALPSY